MNHDYRVLSLQVVAIDFIFFDTYLGVFEGPSDTFA